MGNGKGSAILITMGLIMICLFLIAMLHPPDCSLTLNLH